MVENNPERIRLGRVSQTAFVRHERAATRITRPQIDDNSFDGSQCRGLQPSDSTSRSCMSHACSLRGHEFQDDEATIEAPEV